MTEITDLKIYDLKESIIACRNSMRIVPAENTEEEFEQSLERPKKLVKLGNGHDNFLCGIRVSFNLKYPNYLQLKTIYKQRKNHKLKEDWGAICSMIEGLPYSELITQRLNNLKK